MTAAAALRRVVVEAVDRSRGGSSRLLGELRGVLDDLYLVESSRLSDDDDEEDGPDSTAARHRAKVIDHGLEDALRRRDVPALRRLLRDVAPLAARHRRGPSRRSPNAAALLARCARLAVLAAAPRPRSRTDVAYTGARARVCSRVSRRSP